MLRTYELKNFKMYKIIEKKISDKWNQFLFFVYFLFTMYKNTRVFLLIIIILLITKFMQTKNLFLEYIANRSKVLVFIEKNI